MFTNDSLMAHSQHLDGRTAADASRPRVADEQAAAAGPDEHREGGEEGADVEPGVQHPTHAISCGGWCCTPPWASSRAVQRPGRQAGYASQEVSRKCLGSV